MSKNRNQLLFYRSQAAIPRSQIQPNSKLYGSGAVISPQKRSPNKNIQEAQVPHRDCHSNHPTEIDRKRETSRVQQHFLRSRSGDHLSWRSPSKLQGGDNFKSIFEEINEQNERNFSQLDTDLKRIKSNLTRIEQEGSEAKISSHNQALLEEVQILQQQNDRLREKNIALIAEKKKMSKEIEEYQSVLQREKVKQFLGRNHVEIKEDLLATRKLKIELEEKISECQRLKQAYAQLLSSKASWEKREGLFGQEKNKLAARIAQLQREKDKLQIAFEEDLQRQMAKRDNHYSKLIKTQEAKYEQVILRLKENLLKSNQMEKEYIAIQTKEELERLRQQQIKVSDNINNIKNQKNRIQNQKEQLERKVDAINNQLQLLSFSYRELSDNIIEKDSIIVVLKKKIALNSEDLKRKCQQIEGMRLKFQEEEKRVHYLQQLCNKLERQLAAKESEEERSRSQLDRALAISQKEVQMYQIAQEKARKERIELEEEIKQASREKERYLIELKKKTEEVLLLKKENILLVQQTKSVRHCLSPERTQKEGTSERAEQRLQRMNSARDFRESQAKNANEPEQARLKRIEKELTDLMNQYRLQSQKSKNFYREKQQKLQDLNKNQERRINEFVYKLEQAERQLRSKTQELSRQEESMRQINHKKQFELSQQKRKAAELQLKNKSLEEQLQSVKRRMSDFMANKYQERLKEAEQRISSLREQFKKCIAAIASEISELHQSSANQNSKVKAVQISCKQLKSLQDIRNIAELTYSIHSLGNYIRSLQKRLKEASSRQHQIYSQTILLDRSQSVAEDHPKNVNAQKQGQRTAKILEQGNDHENSKDRSNEMMERRYRRLLAEYEQRVRQIQALHEQIRVQRRQIARLKQELEQSEQEKEDFKVKYRNIVEKQAKRQSQKVERIQAEREYPSFEYLTPVKEYSSFRQQALEKDFEKKMRVRIRSARSCEKREEETKQEKEFERKMLNYESSLNKLHQDLEEMSQKLQKMQKGRDEGVERERRLKKKIEEAVDSLEMKEDQLQRQSREKSRLQAKNKEIQYQLGMITEQKNRLEAKMSQAINQAIFDKLKIEKEMKQTLLSKQLVEKKLKKELQDKEERLISVIQQYELKIIDMNSQINRCNQSINELNIKLASFSSLNGQYSTRLAMKEEKLSQQEKLVREGKQRLEREQRERENLVGMFSSNTTRLTKIIQEKEIEIEQLKFIQETTLINLDFARSQQLHRTPSDSTYSFKNDF